MRRNVHSISNKHTLNGVGLRNRVEPNRNAIRHGFKKKSTIAITTIRAMLVRAIAKRIRVAWILFTFFTTLPLRGSATLTGSLSVYAPNSKCIVHCAATRREYCFAVVVVAAAAYRHSLLPLYSPICVLFLLCVFKRIYTVPSTIRNVAAYE